LCPFDLHCAYYYSIAIISILSTYILIYFVGATELHKLIVDKIGIGVYNRIGTDQGGPISIV